MLFLVRGPGKCGSGGIGPATDPYDCSLAGQAAERLAVVPTGESVRCREEPPATRALATRRSFIRTGSRSSRLADQLSSALWTHKSRVWRLDLNLLGLTWLAGIRAPSTRCVCLDSRVQRSFPRLGWRSEHARGAESARAPDR